ncbi:MBL fold metallo-hydrolase [Klebsiella aerogenes]|nr:MBL fold metallo-hydrolase [Klebsiella aerogenes]
MALTIRVLLENRRAADADSALIAKPGLSLLIEDDTSKVLFDTGPDGSFADNAQRLGMTLDDLTATVLSHGHYDHCGGVPWLPEGSRIICHPQLAQPRYAAISLGGHAHKIKKLSCDHDYSRYHMEYYRQPFAISERLLWSGEIVVASPRAYGVLAGEQETRDYIVDEGVLIYLSDRGLVIISGCGHRGIENIVRHCQNITGIERVYAVVGGLHLRTASVGKVLQVRRFLQQLRVEKIMACHCTGTWGQLWLAGAQAPATGDVLRLD